MAGHKRDAHAMYIPSRQELILKLDDIGHVRDKALICFLYLTGARITEVLGDAKKGIPSFKARQIEEIDDKRGAMVVFRQLPILKRRGTTLLKRDVMAFVDMEKPFLEPINAYWSTIEDLEQPMFPITRQRAWFIMNKKFGWFNHFFRNARATHLANEYGFSGMTLQAFFGWASWQMPMLYTKTTMRDVTNALANAKDNIEN